MYNKNTKNLTFGILAVLVSVVAVGLAYAGFSQTLNINGSANVISSKWDIYFANLSSANTTGTASLVTGANIIAKTTIGTYDVEFYTPGDSLTYTFDVTNQGDFDAILYNLTKSAPTCSSSDSNASANRVCSHLTYTLKYTSNNQDVAEGDTLLVGETKNMTLKLVYNLDTPASALPSVDVVVSSLGITMTYNQNSSYGGNPVVVPTYLYTSAYNYGNALHLGSLLEIDGTTVFDNFEDAKYYGQNFTTAHITNDNNEITESYIAFKTTGSDTIYYLKAFDASAFGDNQAELDRACSGQCVMNEFEGEYYYDGIGISVTLNINGEVTISNDYMCRATGSRIYCEY